ncbi:MAG: hypothetical protein K2M68_06585, partial [Muribaculaceae bacterium]|nr:hypothetical protein [Muribaculaceae bacterium]
QELTGHGAVYASMSGSGSSVFGMFDNADKAAQAAERLKCHGITRICRPV